MVEQVVYQPFVGEAVVEATEAAWPEGAKMINGDKLRGGEITTLVVLCPLYGQGSLEESVLIVAPSGVGDSRVVNKLRGYMKVLAGMNEYVQATGGKINLKVVVANKGVLMGQAPTETDVAALEYHRELYEVVWGEFAREQGMGLVVADYDDLGVEFPRFVEMGAGLPEGVEEPTGSAKEQAGVMIEQFNALLELPEEIVNNKKNRNRVARILEMEGLGYAGAWWMVAGYLVFDHRIAELVGDNGVYLMAERFEPLLSVARMTPSVDGLCRLEIKA